jgi:hypothetical protein
VAIDATEAQPAGGSALVLTNGRRIESSWKFVEADLTRSIRAAEVIGQHARSSSRISG